MAWATRGLHADCKGGIEAELRAHGFTLDSSGIRADVDIVLWSDRGALELRDARYVIPYHADLTVTLHVAGQPRQVLATGYGMATEGHRRPEDGPSRLSACGVAAERLAIAIAEALARP
jgi:hypothetical protein